MRVVHATLDGNLPRYGIGLAVVRLCGALAARGHDVTLLARAEGAREVAARALAPGVRVVGLEHVRGWWGGRRGYVAQVRRAVAPRADVVHVHTLTRLARWLVPARARRGAPLVVTAHASDELGPAASAAGGVPGARARRHARHVARVLARAAEVVAPSRWMADRVAAVAGRAVHAIGLGATEDVASDVRAHEGFTVLVLGRLVVEKGVDLLLEGVARGLGDDPTATLVVAGDGPERAALERRAAERAPGRVRFVGYAEGAARRALLADADVVAVPTRGDYETFGLAALDASAAGVALLVAGGGALPERVAAGEGRCVASGDPDAWARALRALRDDPAGRRRMGDAGRASARAQSWDASAAAHEALYATL